MEWDSSYATGIARIDEQHQALFRTVGEIRTAIASASAAGAYAQLLSFLDRYCRDHFSYEERCMLQHRCPTAQTNKAQHAALIEMLTEHRRWHATHGYDAHDAQIMVDALEHWLHNHICRVDLPLKHCVGGDVS